MFWLFLAKKMEAQGLWATWFGIEVIADYIFQFLWLLHKVSYQVRSILALLFAVFL